MSVAVCEDHTVEAYSNYGRTKILYSVDFRSLFWTQIFLLMKPSVWFAFFEVLFVGVYNHVIAVYSGKKLQHYATAYRNHKSAGETLGLPDFVSFLRIFSKYSTACSEITF